MRLIFLLLIIVTLSSCKDSREIDYLQIQDGNVITQSKYAGKVVAIDYSENIFKVRSSASGNILSFSSPGKTQWNKEKKDYLWIH